MSLIVYSTYLLHIAHLSIHYKDTNDKSMWPAHFIHKDSIQTMKSFEAKLV